MFTLTFETQSAFYSAVEELVKRGLGFRAIHETLTITLTGAY